MPPYIVSASRRTDIPAFHGEWFRERLRAGWCQTTNPFTGETYHVSLAPGDVLGWVFWSRNYAPFLDTLAAIHAQGGRFICHLTLTAYPRVFEPRTPPLEHAIAVARRMAETFGSETVLWRYDPILLSSLTPPHWHIDHFARLAKAFEGLTQRCYFSFPDMYKKTARNLAALDAVRVWSRRAGDFEIDDLSDLSRRLAAIAARRGIEMLSCCGRQWIAPDAGIGRANCADWPLLRTLLSSGESVRVPRAPTRKECGCYKSVDIGRYHTCGHGCPYCYAVENPDTALANLAKRDPQAPKL